MQRWCVVFKDEECSRKLTSGTSLNAEPDHPEGEGEEKKHNHEQIALEDVLLYATIHNRRAGWRRNIKIIFLTKEYEGQTQIMVKTVFTEGEPVTNHMEILADDFGLFSDPLVTGETERRPPISLIAVDMKTDEVVSFGICTDMCDPEGEEPNVSADLGQIFEFIEDGEGRFYNTDDFNNERGHTMHYFVGGTRPDCSGAGIGILMRRLAILVANLRGYRELLVECFNGAAHHIWADKLDGRDLGHLVSPEWTNAGGVKPFQDMDTENSTWRNRDRVAIPHRVALVACNTDDEATRLLDQKLGNLTEGIDTANLEMVVAVPPYSCLQPYV